MAWPRRGDPLVGRHSKSLNRDKKKGKLPPIPDADAAGTGGTLLNAALDARAHSNAVAAALSKPSLFDSELTQTQPALAAAVPMHMYVRFALLRGVCGARGPAEASLAGDVLMYTYPTMPLRNGVQMDRGAAACTTPAPRTRRASSACRWRWQSFAAGGSSSSGHGARASTSATLG